MSMLLCRASEDIPVEYLQKVASVIDKKFEIKSQTLNDPIKVATSTRPEEIAALLHSRVGNSTFVAIMLTRENISDDYVLGIGTLNERIVFVSYTENLDEDMVVIFHNLGHSFGVGHCIKCVMNPNNYGNVNVSGGTLTSIFCDRCRTTLQGSDLFQIIQNKDVKKTEKTEPSKKTEKTTGKVTNDNPFPEYDLLNSNPYEFLYGAFKHYNFGEKK